MMRRLVAWFVRYPVWTTVLMFGMFGFGLISLALLRYSFFPEITPDVITVRMIYPGASPEEVAEGVVLKIEEKLDGVDGVDRITSVSRESMGTVTVETVRSADIDKVLNDVRNAVDQISSFPVDAEKPIIFERKFRERALSIVLYGETDLYNLKTIAEHFRDELLATDEISQVSIDGVPSLEFSIEVSEEVLRRYGLRFDEIRNAVREANINLSGGKFETAAEEILIRAWGRSYRAPALREIPVRRNPDGTAVLLGDVANVREQWQDVPDRIWFNGQSAVHLNVDQAAEEDIIAIAEKGRELVDDFNTRYEGLHAGIQDDRTVHLRQRLQLLLKNGLIGIGLIIIALGLFLKLRLSFWVAVGIPFSFAGMFIVAQLWGITINVISLFGMIVVVGILVDDAIVVAENIYAHTERGTPPLKAAVDGTMEMLAPVTTSVLTTVFAFLPFFFLDGMMGKFIWQMALVVIASLLFSLVEAFLVLPSHLGHSQALDHSRPVSPLRRRIDAGITHLTQRIYAPTLRFALDHKWAVVALPIALIMITIGLLGGGIIGTTFFPFIDGDTIPVNVSLVPGSQEESTERLLARIEEAAWRINDEIREEREGGEDVILGISRVLGTNALGDAGSHAGRLTLRLLDGEHRQMDSFLISNRIREAVGPVPEARQISFGRTGHFGKPVSISLLGQDRENLAEARDRLVTELKDFDNLKDVTDTDEAGRRELDIRLKPRAHALGLTLSDVAGQVRQGFFGQEIQRIQRGRDEIRVWVRYRPEDRASLAFLERMRIRTPDGGEYPFGELAEYGLARGVTAINRLDRMREVRVEATQADVHDDLPPILAEIREEVLPRLLAETSGVRASFEGQSRQRAKQMRSMRMAFPLAVLGMFILVVLVFRSYAQAGMIFSLIPIGILGAVWGHGIQGLQVNMLSLYGIIALSGIIINDSIVFVDQYNRFLRQGQKVHDAVFNAGLARLRPILLTTLTTALGLAPLILEKSRQAQFLIPMAVSVAYGLLFGTIILLVILPASILAYNRLRLAFARYALGRSDASPESVEPAVREMNREPVH